MKMKLDKGAILASMAIIMVASIFAGAGTNAWFFSEKTSTGNTFTAGTLTIELGGNVPISSPSGWAPGESFTVEIHVENTGDVDARYLGVKMDGWTGTSPSLAEVIEVTRFKEWIPGYGWLDNIEGYTPNYATKVKNYDIELTLGELIRSEWEGDKTEYDWATGWGYDPVPEGYAAIPAGTTYKLVLEFTFMESAGNEYQGATCSFDITFMGTQDLSTLY